MVNIGHFFLSNVMPINVFISCRCREVVIKSALCNINYVKTYLTSKEYSEGRLNWLKAILVSNLKTPFSKTKPGI